MRFSRIRLENWRNFRTIDVKLQNRVFLVGANASGKSNFLDAFRFLRDVVVPGGGFIDSVERRGGVSRIRNLAARHPHTDISIAVEMKDDSEDVWEYRIAFNRDKSRRTVLKQERVCYQGKIILQRPNKDDERDNERLYQTHLEQTFANREFRPIKEFFESVHYSHLVPQLVRDSSRWTGHYQSDPFGEDFLEQIAAASDKSQKARLRRIEQVLRLAVPQLSVLKLERDNVGSPHLYGNYAHWRPAGAWQTEVDFSDGTLRLIGLLWALQEGEGPILLEEPELSLHTGIVRRLPAMIHRIRRLAKLGLRQVIISTHSPEIFRDEGIAADEVFLFIPKEKGTEVHSAMALYDVRVALEADLPLSETILSLTEPENAHNLPLFGN